MSSVRYPPPSREQLERLWLSKDWTLRMIAARFHVSESLVASWAKRYGFGNKRLTPYATPLKRPGEDWTDSAEPVNDGPMVGDPTPEEIRQRAEALRQAHIAERMREPPA